VWSIRYAGDPIDAVHTAGFWEVFDGSPVTGSELRVTGAGMATERVAGRTLFATRTASVRRNRNDLFWKASYQLPRKLQELSSLGPGAFFARADHGDPAPAVPSGRRLAAPTLLQEMTLLSRVFWRIYSSRVRNLVRLPQWMLLFDFNDDFPPAPAGFRRIVPPRDRIWADPHVLIKDRRHYVFIEELLYGENKGCIAVMEINEDGTHTPPRRVLETHYHLSHPFVFEHDGQIFLIPESAENRTVDLYRCVSFPDEWVHCDTLLRDVYAVDTTAHFRHGKWWLFTNIREHETGPADDDLFLFTSDTLPRGRWRAHPANPIVSDVTRARPAGNIVEHEGRLYRPAQDCSIRYGYAIRILEILALSESEYAEREIAYMEPGKDTGIIAMHTLNRAGRLVLSDAQQERWKLPPRYSRDGR
jgi:hypothetical protein